MSGFLSRLMANTRIEQHVTLHPEYISVFKFIIFVVNKNLLQTFTYNISTF
jgi:hypothetical protein